MPYTKYAVANLSQGVSQQAASQRYDSQASEQINGYSSHIKGLVKRPPLKHISSVGVNASTGTQSFLHLMNRDASEQYAVVINKGVEVSITGVDTTTGRVWDEGVSASIMGSLNYTSNSDAFAVNDPVQFRETEATDRLPAGIRMGVTYYVHSFGVVSGNDRWLILKADTSTSSATNYITLGQVELTSQNFAASGDEYKAGLLIESVRHSDGTWTDGIITVRFSSPQSGTGHTFSNGDRIQIKGLLGTAKYVLFADEYLELSQPAKTQGVSGRALNIGASSETSNKFWLKIPSGFIGRSSHYGYRTDGKQLWHYIEYVEKFNAGESPSDWAGFEDSGTTFSVDGAVLTKVSGSLDPSTVPLGTLIKVGSHPKNPRGIVVAVNATTITCAEDLDFTNGAESASNYSLKYWASKKNPAPKFRYFAETDYRTAGKYALVGDDGGTCKAVGGDKGAGPYVFDLNTGTQYPVETDTLLGDPHNYLLDVTNPATDIKAKTIGDTTFLLNKKRAVEEMSWTPHKPTYEAFITVRTADYGKYYKIKVGSEAVNAVANEADGAVPAKASTLLYGSSTTGDHVASRPICMIRARNKGGYNNFHVRLMQNHTYKHAVGTIGSTTNMTFPSVGTPHVDLLPSDKSYGKNVDGSKQELRRVNAKLMLDAYQNVEGDAKAATQDHDTDYVAIHYNPVTSEIFIWINFYWANSSRVTSKLTKIKDVKAAIESLPMGEYWEVVLVDENGTAADDSPSGTVATEDWYFLDSELGTVGVEHYVDNTGKTRDYKGATTYKIGNEEYHVGKDYIVRSFGRTFEDFDNVSGTMREYIRIGLQSPSTPVDGDTTPRLPATNRGRTFTAGGAGTAEQTALEDGGTLKVFDGEYFYKSPKWVGDEDQKAIGTERIAEVLASNALIIKGGYEISGGTGKLKRPDGRTLTADQTVYTADAKEEAIGLTFTRSALDVETLLAPDAWQTDNENYTQFLQKVSDGGRLENLNWIIEQVGSVISIRNAEKRPFDISVSDDLGGNGLNLTFFEVEEAAKLPEVCRHGHVVRVVGNAREEADDYYLRFEADKGDSSKMMHGRWVECLGFNTTSTIDPSTLPVMLQRQWNSDGTRKFLLKHRNWNERIAGDDTSNPMPAFIGKRLSDIFLFKNRLGFLAGESVALSESGEYFNFFRSTVAALLDTSPINVLAASEKVSKLHTALTYAERLLLFSESQQFSLLGNQYLSPKTVSVTPTTDFLNSAAVRPVLAGSTVFFSFPRTDFGGISEYFLSKEQLDSLDAKDITAHIPKYLEGDIKKMAVCSSEDVMAVLTNKTGSARLFIYKFFLDNNNQKTQSAWFTYTTGDGDAQILDIEFISNTLFLIIKRGSSVYIESLLFEDAQKDTGMDYEVLLDRRLTVDGASPPTGVTVTYNSSYQQTKIGLPYNPTADLALVKTDGTKLTPLTSATQPVLNAGWGTLASNEKVFAGQLNNLTFHIGEPYTMEYTFSRPYLRSGGGEGRGVLTGGRHQIRRGTLEFSNSRTFDVAVTHQPQDTTVSSSYSFNGTELGFASAVIGADYLSEGFYKFGIMGRNDRVTLKLTNSSPYPSDFLSMDYEGTVYSRGKRWRG